ncbi:hypothetical protein L9W92_18420, partial [Pelotomaculum terephthalicicum JT]|uniref:RHS repeat-associated core domain-containing protein n=1 Tax=Pelotomaculum terephthalicicum TaxID=206393 RepID=UPI00249E8645
NRLISITDPGGSTETYTLDGNGNQTAKTDQNGHTTTYTYDALNRITNVTDALGNTEVIVYDPLGNKTSVTDRRGNTTTFTYDQCARLLMATDPANHTTTYTYDLAGNKLSLTDPRGASWTYAYDDNNRLVAATDPLGHISTTEYDSVGNAVYITDANGVTTTYGYDPLNRLASVTDALGHTTSYTYDNNSNLTAVTNAKNQTFTAAYDALNRLVQETDPLCNTSHKTYDPVGNLSSMTKPDGSEINYTYNANNRLTNITYPNNTGVSYTYDANGNRTAMTDPAGTTGYSYNSLNRLTSVTRDVYSVDYEYDQAGNITALTYPGGLRVSYTYNSLNLPVSVSDSVYSTSISYNEVGNRLQEILPNGIMVNYGYDLSGRLTVLEHVYGQGAIARSAYTLDNVGNRLSATDEQGNTTQYTYDDLYQLTRVEYPDDQTVNYTYDPAGNRTSANGVTYTYDNANRLIQAGADTYAYDLNGNLTSVSDATYNNCSYNYDYENRLLNFSDGTRTIQYSYDGDGNRLSQSVSVSGSVYRSDEYSYIYDINTGIPRLLAEKDDTGNINSYTYAGRLLSRIDPVDTVYYHQDGLGSISVITDVYSNPLNRYTYDAFGSPRSVSESVYNTFRFTGEPYDANGLIYLRARYYNPVTGRFLSQDTLQGKLNDPLSQNRYVYCGNNPVLYVDPSGHLEICGIYTIMWSYAKEDLIKYTNTIGEVDWDRFTQESSFARTAYTRKNELLASGFNDGIDVQRIDNKEDLQQTWDMFTGYDKISGMDVFSHGYPWGPEVAGGSGEGEDNFWNYPKRLNWSSNAEVVFHGCETSEYANRFALMQDVITYGQEGKSSFSLDPTKHTPIWLGNSESPVYLYDYEYMKLYNNNGWGKRYQYYFSPNPIA